MPYGLAFGLSSSNCLYGKCWLPHMKTKLCSKWLLFTDSQCATSELCVLKFHLFVNACLPKSLPLFIFETFNGGWSPMWKEWFLARCCQAWSLHFPSPIMGHSFHIGGTTHLLLLGVNPFIMMVQGQWSSNTFLAYWWNCKENTPLFIGFSLDSQSSIVMTMSHFKDHLINKN